MYRKRNKMAAFGLAILIGAMMPMSTMLAAEDNTEVGQETETDSVSDADADEVCDDEVISDENGSVDEEENAVEEADTEEENAGGEVNADDGNAVEEVNADEVSADDVIADEEAETVDEQNAGIYVVAVADVAGAGAAEVQENTDAPVISITWQGKSFSCDMGGKIDYEYINYLNQKIEISASQGGEQVSFSYYVDRVEDLAAEAKSAEDIKWPDMQSSSVSFEPGANTNYVIYVKAVGTDGQTVYARSGGIVVDTIVPEIIGVKEGETYPEGTAFTVSDANLDVVKVNEKVAAPESDGSYRVRANGTSCVIRAIDKAGNEKTCSIIVTGGNPEEDPEEDTVISESKEYALKAGVKYHLAAGKWKVNGDKTVYQGDSDFYVREDGNYKFKK